MDGNTQPTDSGFIHGLSDLTFELSCIRKDLLAFYEKAQWPELAEALGSLAAIGEDEGQKQLCLRAQSLREVLRTSPNRTEPRIEELFQELLSHLSHFEWMVSGRKW